MALAVTSLGCQDRFELCRYLAMSKCTSANCENYCSFVLEWKQCFSSRGSDAGGGYCNREQVDIILAGACSREQSVRHGVISYLYVMIIVVIVNTFIVLVTGLTMVVRCRQHRERRHDVSKSDNTTCKTITHL